MRLKRIRAVAMPFSILKREVSQIKRRWKSDCAFKITVSVEGSAPFHRFQGTRLASFARCRSEPVDNGVDDAEADEPVSN